MAIAKAKAQITISRIVDISSTTRYYRLVSSTTSAPAAPTTNPPASTWTTTEPSYSAGSTNTLYFVDLTIFTNGTFSYSAVSKSSTYEAAKEAYNKAVNAQKVATNYMDNIQGLGLVIGNLTNATLGKNVLIGAETIDFRNGGTILATYGADRIELAKNNRNAEIDLCNSLAVLKNYGDDYNRFQICADDSIELTSGAVNSDTYFTDGTTAASTAMRLSSRTPWDGPDVMGRISLYSSTYLENGSGLFESELELIKDHARLFTSGTKGVLELDLDAETGFIEASGNVSIAGYLKVTDVKNTRKNIGVWGYDTTTNPSYPGIVKADGSTAGYLRTPESGIIPFKTGGASNIGTSSWPFNYGYFKHLFINGVELADSGWQTATISSDFVLYNSYEVVKYRKFGKMVTVSGTIKPAAVIKGSSDNVTIFTLPSGYRPPRQVAFRCQGSGTYSWLLTITTGGVVRFSRYNDGAKYVDTSTTSWLPFDVMFFID